MIPRTSQRRINYLLANQPVGKRVFMNLPDGPLMPNCFGTLFYVLEFPRFVEKDRGVFILGDRPGYVYPDIGRRVMGDFKFAEAPEEGVIVGWPTKNFPLGHVGLMLDKHNFFNQWGHGGNFCVLNIEQIIGNPVYYQRAYTREAEGRLSREVKKK